MTERWRDQLRQLEDLAPSAELWERAKEGPRFGLPQRRVAPRLAGAFVLLAFLSVAGYGAWRLFGVTYSVRPSRSLGPTLPNYCAGERLTLAEARRVTPFRLLVPEHPLASEAELANVFGECPHTDLIAMEFRSGVLITQETSTLPNPAAAWERYAEAYPEARVGAVRGHPALLIDPEKDPSDQTEGGIKFVEGGVLIIVAGNGEIPLSTLVEVAQSLT